LPKAISRFDSSKINGFYRSNKKRILALLILSTLVFSIYLPIVPDPTKSWNFTFPLNSHRNELIDQMLSLIPSNASILTQNDIFPHLSNRAEAYMYLDFSEISVDYILVDNASQWYTWAQPAQFGTRIPPCDYVKNAIDSGTYGTYASANYTNEGFIFLLKKGYSGRPITGEPVVFNLYSRSFNFKELFSGNGSVVKDASSASGFVMNCGVDNYGVLWFGPYVNLLPGLYKVTYVIKVDETTNKNSNDLLLVVDVTHSSGKVTVRETPVYRWNVSSNEGWLNATLIFGLTQPAQDVEFRGIGVEAYNVSLDYLTVNQISKIPFAFSPDALFADVGEVIDGVMVNEIGYSVLPQGNYIVKFWPIFDKSYTGPIDINITDITETPYNLLNSITIDISSLAREPFKVNFEQSESNVRKIEFSVTNVQSLASVSLLLTEVVLTDTGE
jgi:hypothetical protein